MVSSNIFSVSFLKLREPLQSPCWQHCLVLQNATKWLSVKLLAQAVCTATLLMHTSRPPRRCLDRDHHRCYAESRDQLRHKYSKAKRWMFCNIGITTDFGWTTRRPSKPPGYFVVTSKYKLLHSLLQWPCSVTLGAGPYLLATRNTLNRQAQFVSSKARSQKRDYAVDPISPQTELKCQHAKEGRCMSVQTKRPHFCNVALSFFWRLSIVFSWPCPQCTKGRIAS